MRVDLVAFTARGLDTAGRIAETLRHQGEDVHVAAPARLASDGSVEGFLDLAAWTKETFSASDALVFVCACGIAVRSIAPCLNDKLTDPAVVCLDELGTYAISLLSGHVGGANALASRIAAVTGGQAVITTATDVEGVFAVDVWAAGQDLVMLERDVAKKVSATLLEGGHVGLSSDVPVEGALPEGLVTGSRARACDVGILVGLDAQSQPFGLTLHVVPRIVSVGIGCKRGTSEERIRALVNACLDEAHVAPEAVGVLATIDVKADEEGIRALGEHLGVPVRLHSAQELQEVEGQFHSSEFVRRTVGVDNVCERAACAAGETLLLGRHSADGVTVALGVAEKRIAFADGIHPEGA